MAGSVCTYKKKYSPFMSIDQRLPAAETLVDDKFLETLVKRLFICDI